MAEITVKRYSVLAKWSALVSLTFATVGWSLLLVRVVIFGIVPEWERSLSQFVGDPLMIYTLQSTDFLLMIPTIIFAAIAGRRGRRGLALGIVGIVVSAVTQVM